MRAYSPLCRRLKGDLMKRVLCLLTALLVPALLTGQARSAAQRYDDLQGFFRDWRAFQKPKMVQGVPDCPAAAMAAQQQALATYRKRLEAIDTTGWTVPQRVDYLIVRAEMAGMDFDHRVLRPWERNPAFY